MRDVVHAHRLVSVSRGYRGRSLLAAGECFDAAIRLDPDNTDACALLGDFGADGYSNGLIVGTILS